jgi:hypothetical protein
MSFCANCKHRDDNPDYYVPTCKLVEDGVIVPGECSANDNKYFEGGEGEFLTNEEMEI